MACINNFFSSIMGQGDERGILPRFCEELFERIKCWKEVHCIYFAMVSESGIFILSVG